MRCPKCNCEAIVLTNQIVNQELIRDLACLNCDNVFSKNLGKPEIVFVDFKNKIILNRKKVA